MSYLEKTAYMRWKLTVLDECTELLAETVDEFAGGEVEF